MVLQDSVNEVGSASSFSFFVTNFRVWGSGSGIAVKTSGIMTSLASILLTRTHGSFSSIMRCNKAAGEAVEMHPGLVQCFSSRASIGSDFRAKNRVSLPATLLRSPADRVFLRFAQASVLPSTATSKAKQNIFASTGKRRAGKRRLAFEVSAPH